MADPTYVTSRKRSVLHEDFPTRKTKGGLYETENLPGRLEQAKCTSKGDLGSDYTGLRAQTSMKHRRDELPSVHVWDRRKF